MSECQEIRRKMAEATALLKVFERNDEHVFTDERFAGTPAYHIATGWKVRADALRQVLERKTDAPGDN